MYTHQRNPETRYLSDPKGWDVLGDIIYGHLYDEDYEGDGIDQRDDSTVWLWDVSEGQVECLIKELNKNDYPVVDYTVLSTGDEEEYDNDSSCIEIIFHDDYPQHDDKE